MPSIKNLRNRLMKVLDYNPRTGVFLWKIASGTARVGQTAGAMCPNGYLRITYRRRGYFAHRLAWLFTKGHFPEHGIDHIDRDKTNNEIINLREVSHVCNARNCGNLVNNTSGVKGVSRNRKQQAWQVHIRTPGKRIGLGNYKDFDNAVCARLAAEQCLDWNGCDSSSPAYSYVTENIQKNGGVQCRP